MAVGGGVAGHGRGKWGSELDFKSLEWECTAECCHVIYSLGKVFAEFLGAQQPKLSLPQAECLSMNGPISVGECLMNITMTSLST